MMDFDIIVTVLFSKVVYYHNLFFTAEVSSYFFWLQIITAFVITGYYQPSVFTTFYRSVLIHL